MPSYSGVWDISALIGPIARGEWPTSILPTAYGFWAGGMTNTVQYAAISRANLSTTGNFSYFSDLTVARQYGGVGLASTTRGLFCGGFMNVSPTYSNAIDYITFATVANAVDFGDLLSGLLNGVGGCSSSTRGVIMGGSSSTTADRWNVMQYVTIATTGNATDFGDLSQGLDNLNQGISSGTRGAIAGGYGSSTGTSNAIEYITIASTGNAADFGDLTSGRFICAGFSSSTRGVWAGGSSTNIIDYVTIASTGNATDFGDLNFTAGDTSAINNGVRGVVARSGGSSTSYVTIATTGNAATFGDLYGTAYGGMLMGCSGSQGGL